MLHSEKTLVVVRHAHRTKELGQGADNGLSEKGREQARRVAELFKRRFESEDKPRLISSPKKRCRETLEPLADRLGIAVEIDPILDEGEQVEKRVRELVSRWKSGPDPLLVICSHGDVIPLLLELLVGAELELKKGAWAQVDLEHGHARLFELIQKP